MMGSPLKQPSEGRWGQRLGKVYMSREANEMCFTYQHSKRKAFLRDTAEQWRMTYHCQCTTSPCDKSGSLSIKVKLAGEPWMDGWMDG